MFYFEAITNLMHKCLYSYNITTFYMFRALLFSSSGGQILYVQHLVMSLSMSGRTLRWLRESSLLTSLTYGCSQRVTVPDAVHIQLNLLKMSIIMLKTCRFVHSFTYSHSIDHTDVEFVIKYKYKWFVINKSINKQLYMIIILYE